MFLRFPAYYLSSMRSPDSYVLSCARAIIPKDRRIFVAACVYTVCDSWWHSAPYRIGRRVQAKHASSTCVLSDSTFWRVNVGLLCTSDMCFEASHWSWKICVVHSAGVIENIFYHTDFGTCYTQCLLLDSDLADIAYPPSASR